MCSKALLLMFINRLTVQHDYLQNVKRSNHCTLHDLFFYYFAFKTFACLTITSYSQLTAISLSSTEVKLLQHQQPSSISSNFAFGTKFQNILKPITNLGSPLTLSTFEILCKITSCRQVGVRKVQGFREWCVIFRCSMQTPAAR